MTFQNKRCIFTKYATGPIDESNFQIESFESNEEPQAGQVLVQLDFISVDPYMRARMNESQSYFANFKIGQPYDGGVTGVVLKSNDPKFKEGDHVSGMLPWILYQVTDASSLTLLPDNIRASYFLGMLGMPGLSAYFSIHDIGQVKAGQTVFISGAAGAVGAVVGQICKNVGCKVIGSAGTNEKLQYLKDIGFDGVINYKNEDQSQKLKELAPEGIDIYYDNVGGVTLDIALEHMKQQGVIVACGQISNYDNSADDKIGNKNLFYIISKRLRMQGYLIFDYIQRYPEGTQALVQLFQDGKLKIQETIVKGFENIPKALLGLFKGDNTGKMIVEL